MAAQRQPAASAYDINFRAKTFTLVFAGFLLTSILAATAAQAQTFNIIHAFTGGADGGNPLGRLTIDGGGHLYGTTYSGGVQFDGGFGVVFRMTPTASGWTFAPIWTFSPEGDGGDPANGVLFGPGGLLYGTTSNAGTVFTVRPSATRPRSALEPWNLNFLYDFTPFTTYPYGDLTFDSAGNIYGATTTGGNRGCFNNEGCGMVYELTPSNGGWVLTPLYIFQGGADGEAPVGVSFDSDGNLIGLAAEGGTKFNGVIFKLTRSGNSWTEIVLYNFDCGNGGGCGPDAGLTPDGLGNFYGSTGSSSIGSGTIFELSPSNGGWVYTVIAQIPGVYPGGPSAPLTMDAAGNLYGTIGSRDTRNPGAVFKVTHGGSGWTFTTLHAFSGSDGLSPASTVAIGADGKLYGTATYGGPNCLPGGCGLVWEITP